MSGVCRWCGASARLTREHVFPNWLNPLFPAAKPYEVTWVHEWTGHARQSRVHQSPGIDQTVKTVCAPCNNGWMSHVESQASAVLIPMILHTGSLAVDLSDQEQLTVAVWAAMKAGVAEDLGARPVMTSVQRDSLRLHGSPPSSCRVHIARYDGVQGPILYQRILGQAPVGHALAGSMAGASVMVIGSLAVFVAVTPGDTYNAVLGLGEQRVNWLACWPPIVPAVAWPPPKAVDERGALELLADFMPGSGVSVDELLSAWEM